MPAITPQQNSVAFASGLYSAVQVSAPIIVPADHNDFLITVERAALPAVVADVLKVRIDLSVDGGLTWSPNPSGAVWKWGAFPIHFSVPGASVSGATVSSVSLAIKAQANQQLRITLTPAVTVNTKIQTATANGPINAAAIS
jgi:hypothetical protein